MRRKAAGDIQFLSSLHLARPQPVEQTTPVLGEQTRDDGGCEPAPGGGRIANPTPLMQPDAQVSLSITTSLIDANRRQAIWRALDFLTRGVDDGDVSHLQISLKVTGQRVFADELHEKSSNAGMVGEVREF